jgi:hypothetical protein
MASAEKPDPFAERMQLFDAAMKLAAAGKPNLHAVEVMRLIDAAMVLPAPVPAAIQAALGIPLPKVPGPLGWEMHEGTFQSGPFTKAKLSYRPDLGSGMLNLDARTEPQSLLELELPLDRFGPRTNLDLNPATAPQGTASHIFSFAGGAREIWFTFTYLTRRFDGVSLRWSPSGWTRPVPPGQERVWDGAPASILLRSYDNVREVLEYAPATRAWILHAADDVPEGHRTFGAFTRNEHGHVAGIFATPDGPAVFLNKTLMLVRPGETAVQLEDAGSNPHRSKFSLVHRSQPRRTQVVDALIYEHRHGVGTNPYDTEREDVDLFAMIATRLEREDFLRAYKRDWCRPEAGLGTSEQATPTAGPTVGTEVRVCSACHEEALVCVRLQPVSECLTATGWSDWRCQSCGASVRLYPQAGIRRLRWMAVPVFFTLVLPAWYLIRAHRLSKAWRASPIASGAVYPAIRFPFKPKQRRCSHCGGVAELSELIQQCTPNGSPLGIRCRYRCRKCDRPFDFESPGGNILNLVGGILFGVGGLLALPAKLHGWDLLWSAVGVLLGAPLLWMAGSQFMQALRNPLIGSDDELPGTVSST